MRGHDILKSHLLNHYFIFDDYIYISESFNSELLSCRNWETCHHYLNAVCNSTCQRKHLWWRRADGNHCISSGILKKKKKYKKNQWINAWVQNCKMTAWALLGFIVNFSNVHLHKQTTPCAVVDVLLWCDVNENLIAIKDYCNYLYIYMFDI